MGLGRDILERDLDVGGLRLFNLRTAVNPSDAVRFDQLTGVYTFTQGLTATGTTVRGDYITGLAGGQVWTGGLGDADNLTIRTTSGANPTGTLGITSAHTVWNVTQIVASGLGVLDALKITAPTITISGSTPIGIGTGFNLVSIGAPTYSGTAPILIAATLAILGPPVGSGLTITSAYALWAAGATRVDGVLRVTTANDTTPSAIPLWDTRHSVFGAGAGNQAAGLAISYSTSTGAVVMSAAEPNIAWRALRLQASRVDYYATGTLLTFSIGGTSTDSTVVDVNAVLNLTPGARGNGSPTLVTLTGPGHTGLAASTEAIDVNLNLARTVNWAAGALATQRAVVVQAPTYTFAGASTVSDAATLAITAAPVAGANATFTRSYALWVQAGNVRIGSLGGMLKATVGIIGVAAAGTDYQAPLSAADTTISFPTASTIKVNLLPSKFIVQGTSDTMLPNAQFLGALSTGLTKHTTTTGVLSTAVSGTDYQAPLSAADTTISFPTAATIKVNQLSNGFIVKGTADAMLTGAQFVGALSTGLTKHTTTTGVLSTAVAGTDYQAPLSAADATISFPTATTVKVGTLANKFIVGGTTDAQLSGAQFTGALATGILKNTTTTGVLSIAVAGTDYEPGLIFSTGLTRATNTITSDLSTGKGGGQSAVGATTSGGFLTLSSTANATKGLINLGTSNYDEANNALSIVSAQTTLTNATLVVASSSASGQMALHFRSNTSSTKGIVRADFAGNMTWVAQGGDHYFLAAGDFGIGNVRAKLHNNGNFLVSPAGVGVNPSDVGALLGVSGTSPQATITRWAATPASIASATSAVLDAHLWDAVTVTLTGGTAVTTATGFNFASILRPSISTTATITNAATLSLSGSPAVTGGGAITNAYALWVQSGKTRLAGPVQIQTLGGMLKGTLGDVSVAIPGTDYEPALTFSTGLTRVSNTITADLSTGVAGGQSAIGGNTGGLHLTLRSNTSSNGKIYFGTTSAGFDEGASQLWLGTATPFSPATAHINRSTNALAELFLTNPNTGGSAGSSFMLGLNPASDLSQRLQLTLLGTNWSAAGLLTAQAGFISHHPNNGAPFILSQQGSGDMIWTTTSSITERARLFNRGEWKFTLGGTATVSTSGTDRAMFDLSSPANTMVANGVAGGVWATVGLMTASAYQGVSGASSATSLASLYIVSAPLQFGGGFTATNNYSIFCDDGVARFDGHGLPDPVFGGTVNTVWEIPDYAPSVDLFSTRNLIPVRVTGVSGVYYIPLVSRSNFGLGQFL